MAASYYGTQRARPRRARPQRGWDLSEAYRAFFEKYRTDLSQDLESALIWRQLLSFRSVNSALAAKTLSEILTERLYGQAPVEDIGAREMAGDSPGLIVNTTLYNNGRRLAVTTLPAEAFDYDFFADLERSLQQRGREMESAPVIRERWKLTFSPYGQDRTGVSLATGFVDSFVGRNSIVNGARRGERSRDQGIRLPAADPRSAVPVPARAAARQRAESPSPREPHRSSHSATATAGVCPSRRVGWRVDPGYP